MSPLKSFQFLSCFTILSLIWSLDTRAQNGSSIQQANYWLSIGGGKTEFPSVMLAVGVEPENKLRVLTARYSLSGELYPAVQPTVKVHELGVLYGVRLGKFRLSTGLSALWGNNRGAYLYTDPDPLFGGGATYEYLKYTTIGIPAEIRFITSTKHVGIGITGYGNLNEQRPFLGLNLSIYVGKMKATGLPSD